MKNFILFCFLIILICGIAYSIDCFSEDSILRFADHLYDEGDYRGALIEYKRLVSLDRRKSPDGLIYYRIALCYEKIRDFKKALEIYRLVLPENNFIPRKEL
ncbi:MAG: tetratricopeptide repeat protein [Brevinematia bacterium]